MEGDPGFTDPGVGESLAELSGYGQVELTRVSRAGPFYVCTLRREEGAGCTGGDRSPAGAVRHCLAVLRAQLYRDPAPAVERLLADLPKAPAARRA